MFLGDGKEEGITTPFLENKSWTKEFGEVTDELTDMPFLENKSLTEYVEKCTHKFVDMKHSHEWHSHML